MFSIICKSEHTLIKTIMLYLAKQGALFLLWTAKIDIYHMMIPEIHRNLNIILQNTLNITKVVLSDIFCNYDSYLTSHHPSIPFCMTPTIAPSSRFISSSIDFLKGFTQTNFSSEKVKR